MFEDDDSVGYIELENGYIITENIMAPHGTGAAGLTFFENSTEFEKRCGTDYKKIKSH